MRPSITSGPTEATIMEEIVERLLKRETLTAIAADLNKRGIPPREWPPAGKRPVAGQTYGAPRWCAQS